MLDFSEKDDESGVTSPRSQPSPRNRSGRGLNSGSGKPGRGRGGGGRGRSRGGGRNYHQYSDTNAGELNFLQV